MVADATAGALAHRRRDLVVAGRDVADGVHPVDVRATVVVDGDGAVGDVTPGHNQIPTAMGEGARCGIGNHYDLRAFPRSVEEIEADGPVAESDVPAISERLRGRAIAHDGHPGREERAPADDD